ncbi:MAG: protein TolR [Alphaproteobacteria bacterium]|nr:protein TolR [Alphaproteobacteria bacterium]|tara:strand:+ start:526 stop:984 length:459 start_codon:yes stop_codon:yes gene_type:complete
MAVVIQNRRGPRLRVGRDFKIMSEINVTPFVDVMLVLLVVFMVTAPLLTVGVQIDLPKTKAGVVQGQDEPLAVSIDGQGRLFLQETEIDLENLVPRLIAISGNKPDIRIFVRGDQSISYGRVMEVMGTINQAGFSRVALITATFDAKGARKR